MNATAGDTESKICDGCNGEGVGVIVGVAVGDGIGVLVAVFVGVIVGGTLVGVGSAKLQDVANTTSKQARSSETSQRSGEC